VLKTPVSFRRPGRADFPHPVLHERASLGVEGIITALSRTRRFFVISRNSSFTYKGKFIDVRQAGKELGVRYVLQGSVRKVASRVRISTQLIDGASAGHVWADRFEGDLEDVFALQDSVTDSLVRAIAPTVRDAELARARRKRPADMGAYDYYLRALPHWYEMTRDGSDEALRLLDQALALDPSFAQALSVKAQVLGYRSILGLIQPVASMHGEILRLAHEAIRYSLNDPEVIASAAHILSWAGAENEEAVQLSERALAMGANSAFVLMQVGSALFHAGRWDAAVDCFEKALKLDPLDPMGFSIRGSLAYALIALCQDAQAIEVAAWAVKQNRCFAWAWRGSRRSLCAVRPNAGRRRRLP
jgi:adenylate cyclase